MTFVEFQSDDYVTVSQALEGISKEFKTEATGGATERGWSYWSTLAKCPRAFWHKYVNKTELPLAFGSGGVSALDVGSAFHAFLAAYYTMMKRELNKTPEGYDYGPKWFYYKLLECKASPQAVVEAWRLFEAYSDHYRSTDYLVPLAVEHVARDPYSGNTCRYDLVARMENPPEGMPSGVAVIEHKSAHAFTQDVLSSWDLDGEILGQIAIWQRAGLDEKFGKLQGVIINITGKQKVPQFHRVIVTPQSVMTKRHLRLLDYLRDTEVQCRKKRTYPQVWTGCVGRYGKCQYYDICATGED